LKESPYFGAHIGRYGNRAAMGRFSLDRRECSLPINNLPISLHGGTVGFDKVLWKVEGARVPSAGLKFTLEQLSADGDQGYLGDLNVAAVYTLTEDNGLRLDFTATKDRAAPSTRDAVAQSITQAR
jgi:aldose 1-epimerase